jgi:hypothetical protein
MAAILNSDQSKRVVEIGTRLEVATIESSPEWRVGKSTGRAIYCGPDHDDAIGFMDTREIAAFVGNAPQDVRFLLDLLGTLIEIA